MHAACSSPFVQKRHRQDYNVNHKIAHVLAIDGVWAPTRWACVKVGDIVRVEDGEAFAADMILLASR